MQADRIADSDLIVRLYRAMFARVGNRSDAEKLTTEAFTRSLRQLRAAATIEECYRVLDSVGAVALSEHWSRRFGPEAARVTDWPQITMSSDNDRTHAGVRRSLAALPADQRTLLELRFVEGCSLEQAARRMRIPVDDAGTLQYEGLVRFGELSRDAATAGAGIAVE